MIALPTHCFPGTSARAIGELPRHDLLFLGMLAVQAILLATGLETFDEPRSS
jgi:uncharacterized membrane protein YoaT (DUF817 family)